MRRAARPSHWHTALLLFAALSLAGSALALAQEPEVTLSGLDGGKLHESELLKRTTLVVVWASWSPHCRDIPQRVAALGRNWGGKARVVTIDFEEEPRTVHAFLAKGPMHAPVFLDSDGAFSKKYGVTSLPGLVVFKDGKVAYRGRFPDDPRGLLTPLLH